MLQDGGTIVQYGSSDKFMLHVLHGGNYGMETLPEYLAESGILNHSSLM